MAAHETLRRDDDTKMSSNKSFGLVFAAVFTVIALGPIAHGGFPRWWAFVIAAGFLAVTYLKPDWLAPLNKLWFKFGILLHHIVSPVLMAAIFVTTITPVGLLMRLTGKDPMRRGYDPAAKSYWIVRTPAGPAPETMKQQF